MIEIMVHVDIPALEHLAQALEKGTGAAVAVKAPETVLLSNPVKVAEAMEPKEEKAQETPQSPTATAPLSGAPDRGQAKEAPKYTLEQVQRASAVMRDQGKLKVVTALFPEFGIRKLGELSGDDEKIQAFAQRMKEAGAPL